MHKEPIDLVEKARELTEHTCIGKKDAREAESKCLACLLNQALTLLKQQPIAEAINKDLLKKVLSKLTDQREVEYFREEIDILRAIIAKAKK